MKGIEKSKAQKLILKIEKGQFDENDIDSLFMRMRAYSNKMPVFREIADFVAHNDQRDRELANQSLETMYLRMKYFLEYNPPKKSLDISQISTEKESISHNTKFVDADGSEVEHINSFGNLHVAGWVVLNNNGKDVTLFLNIINS